MSQYDVLTGISTDPTPKAVSARELIVRAVLAAAVEDWGLVRIDTIRRHLDPSVAPRHLGAALYRLTQRGVLAYAGWYEPNGDTRSRNATKPAPVRRLVRTPKPEDYL